MNWKSTLALIGAIIAIGVSFLTGKALAPKEEVPQTIGSVQRGSEYSATTTNYGIGAIRYKITTSTSALGSVVISSSSAAEMWIYNWNGVGEMTTSGVMVAHFPINATMGTYTFDVFTAQGIYVSTTASFTGNYTITYRDHL